MRLKPAKVSPAAYHAMLGLENFVSKSSKLEVSLLELVKMRASQINGCAFCIDKHSKDARVNSETERRLYALVCMARNGLLYQPRTRSSRMDRSANPYHRRPRIG